MEIVKESSVERDARYAEIAKQLLQPGFVGFTGTIREANRIYHGVKRYLVSEGYQDVRLSYRKCLRNKVQGYRVVITSARKNDTNKT